MAKVELFENDLPPDFELEGDVAVDTETMGIVHHRDRLCLIQIRDQNQRSCIVRLPLLTEAGVVERPGLKAVLADPKRVKIMHYARFDLASIYLGVGIMAAPVFCTKIASRLGRTYSDRHALKDVVKEMLGVDMDKSAQTTDWGSDTLTQKQLDYAAGDVAYLHQLRDKLSALLEREQRLTLARQCFNFLPTRALLDVLGWGDQDIFFHH